MVSDLRFSPRPNRAHLIPWRAWGDAAFAEARAQDKPILLSISATWCHWCHVMDETTYSDDQVIQTIAQDFLPVRVDSDRRPDINHRYNRGGWPTTAFLTPAGGLITGSTYIEPERMRSVLIQVRDYYQEHKAKLEQKTAAMLAQRMAGLAMEEEPVQTAQQVVDAVLTSLKDQFDPDYGGFGAEPKFPTPFVYDLLLHQSHLTGQPELREMLVKTLDTMQRRGIFDHAEGGFFRYATTRAWDQPHYEKLLEDNALLLANYLRAAHLLDNPTFRATAQRILAYLDHTLLDPETGTYFGSQDAEKSYYRLRPSERQEQTPPAVDRTIYTEANGLAVSACVLASWALEQPDHLARAERTLDFLWERLRDAEGLLLHAYHDGAAHGPVLLADQVAGGLALLDVYEATGRRVYLSRALALAEAVMQGFYDTEAGGFWDLRRVQAGQGSLAVRDKPLADNARAAEFFQRLAVATGDSKFGELATAALHAVAGSVPPQPRAAAAYALAQLRVQEEPVHIVIAGSPDDPRTQALLAASLRLKHPHRLVQAVDPEEDADLLDTLGYVAGANPMAYVCYNMACSPPLQDPAAIPQAMERLSRAGTMVTLPPGGPAAASGGGLPSRSGLTAMPFVTLTPPTPPRRKEPEQG